MSPETSAVIMLILAMIVLILIAFVASNLLLKRAIRDVLRMFRRGEALSSETAKFQDELGFKKRSFIQFKALRDYKPTALQLLIRNNIIMVTEEGKVYLSEEALLSSNIEKRQNVPNSN